MWSSQYDLTFYRKAVDRRCVHVVVPFFVRFCFAEGQLLVVNTHSWPMPHDPPMWAHVGPTIQCDCVCVWRNRSASERNQFGVSGELANRERCASGFMCVTFVCSVLGCCVGLAGIRRFMGRSIFGYCAKAPTYSGRKEFALNCKTSCGTFNRLFITGAQEFGKIIFFMEHLSTLQGVRLSLNSNNNYTPLYYSSFQYFICVDTFYHWALFTLF